MIENNKTQISFIALMAILMSLAALAIDSMLPVLDQIGQDLLVQNKNDVQLIISSVFLGMAIGLILFGPLSDSFGRKPPIFIGIIIFILGCLISIFSISFNMMLAGRVLQGVGASSCRVITLAMIRDKFVGNQMAKIMSLIMIVFILVPALAPSIGQAILLIAGWQAIFTFMLVLAGSCALWLYLAQEETLPREKRIPFSVKAILKGAKETIKNKNAKYYTLASGLIFGSFIGYLSSSQQILQIQYELGELFPIYFGILSLSIGVAAYANSKWVEKYSMEILCKRALQLQVIIASFFLPLAISTQGHPPLFTLILFLLVTFFSFGILFGNFNTLAIESLGHIAGVANSVIGSIQTLISVCLGAIIGHSYNGTITPLVSGFLLLGICSLTIVHFLSKKNQA